MQTVKGDDVLAQTRIVVRPLGSALPLGFFAFSLGTIVSTALEGRIIPGGGAKDVAIVMLAFAAPLELLASVFAFLARDTAAGTTLALFGCSWIVQGIEMLQSPLPVANVTLAVFLTVIALDLAILFAVAVKGKPLLALVLALAALRTLAYAIVEFGAATPTRAISEILGWLLCAIALYGAAAFLLEDVRQKPVLPTFRKADAKNALEGDLRDELQRVAHEAGIRKQL